MLLALMHTILAVVLPTPTLEAAEVAAPTPLPVVLWVGYHSEHAQEVARLGGHTYFRRGDGLAAMLGSSGVQGESVGSLPGTTATFLVDDPYAPTVTISWEVGGIASSIVDVKSPYESPNNWAWEAAAYADAMVPAGAMAGDPPAFASSGGTPDAVATWTTGGGAMTITVRTPKKPGESPAQWSARHVSYVKAFEAEFPPDPPQ